jgi:dTDP-4-amino-4,6-dideoxygalactose transaminase
MHFVDLYAQYLSIKPEIDAAIEKVIKESAFVRAPVVDQFEFEFAQKHNIKHCISCGNGTDAIYIALRALGLGSGDEVITTAHSWIATSETITQAGGHVVFCDTEDQYFTIDPEQIEKKITSRTRGIIPVHLYGQPANMDAIQEIAKRHKLWIIEDCAQAHLASYRGRLVGTMGAAATFSFYPGKNLGAMGDAGALITNSDDLAEYSYLFSRHGGKGNHLMEGINSRLDGLHAAILSVKLRYLEKWTDKRQKLAVAYNELLHGIGDIITPRVRKDCRHVYHLYVILTKHRDDLRNWLQDHDIPTVINYPRPLPLYKAYEYLNHTERDFPIATAHANKILSLPLYPEMTDSDLTKVTDAIKSFFKTKHGPT